MDPLNNRSGVFSWWHQNQDWRAVAVARQVAAVDGDRTQRLHWLISRKLPGHFSERDGGGGKNMWQFLYANDWRF